MAYNTRIGIVDLFGGLEDLNTKTIRCVGEPSKRFDEDALRILRAIRFAGVLGFEIEEATAKSAVALRAELNDISAERVFAELKKMLCGKKAYDVLMKFSPIVEQVLPEISPIIGFDQHNIHHIFDLWEHTAVAVCNSSPDVVIRLALLLHDCGKPHCVSTDNLGQAHYYGHAAISARLAEQALLRLKADSATIHSVTELIRLHDTPLPTDKKLLKRRLNRLGENMLKQLIDVQKADNSALAPEFAASRVSQLNDCLSTIDEIIADNECFSLSHLAVNGNDIVSLGFKGHEIGRALNFLLSQVIDGKEENTRDNLIMVLKCSDLFHPM